MKKLNARSERHRRSRNRLIGTPEKPRLNIFRSLKNIYAQVVDDTNNTILLNVSTMDKELKGKFKYGGNVKAASILGETLAQRAKNKGISKVIFDRGGYVYHGRVKAVAEAARKAGLVF